MKKILSIILILSSLLGILCSCSEETTLYDSGKTIKIGIVQFEDKEEYTQAKDAFIKEIQSLEYADRIEIDYQFANNNESELESIVDGFVSKKVDVIVSIAPTATKVAKSKSSGEIPVFFMAVTNPVSERIMSNKSNPRGNVTGITDSVSPDSIINYIIGDLQSGLNNLGIIYNTSEVEHIMNINDFKDYMNTSAITYVESIISNEFEGHKAASDLVYYIDPSTLPFISPVDGSTIYPNGEDIIVGVDAIYISGDTVSKDSLPSVKEFLEIEKADTVVYVASEDMLISPDFATVKPLYRVIGKQAAEMVDAYIRGVPFEQLSCQEPLHYYKLTSDMMTSETWIDEIEDAFEEYQNSEQEDASEPQQPEEEAIVSEEKDEDSGEDGDEEDDEDNQSDQPGDE